MINRKILIGLLLGTITILRVSASPDGHTPFQPLKSDKNASSEAIENTPTCQEHQLSVTLTPEETTPYSVVGSLCTVGTLKNKTIQLLLHGTTYSRAYWDFPYQAQYYSYVRAATRRGYATFNIDRIGSGDSAHPPGNQVTLEANAFVGHQIIQALKNGQIGGIPFEHIVLVGHSLGSMITLILANQYPDDADSIILTGFLHNYAIPEDVFTKLYPANLDPRFSHLNLDADYLTTIPNSRGELFYYLSMADPAVIEVDEQNKETLTWAEIANIVSVITSTEISRAIKVPILLVISQFDGSFCGGQVDCSNYMSIVNHEQNFFSPEACLEVVLIPQSGHVLNLQRNAPMVFANMLTWADQHIGVEGKNKKTCY